MLTVKRLCLVLVALGASIPAQAGITFYSTRASWEAAVGTFTTENFNSVVIGTLAPGVTQVGALQFRHPGPIGLGNLPTIESATLVNGTRGITASVGIDGNPMFGNLPEYNDYIFPYEITAFGANWASASSAGQLVLTIPEGSINLPTYLPSLGTGFFGFTTDV